MTKAAISGEAKNILLDLIEVLQDGHQGMMELGQHMKAEADRQFLLKQSQIRARFAADLENVLHRMGERDVEQRGTLGGTIHRAWTHAKAHLGASEQSLLGAAELGEVGTRHAYEKALAEILPGDIRILILEQQQQILDSLDEIRRRRDVRAA